MRRDGMKRTAKLANRPDGHGVREGYLLLADISGYTAFLTGTDSSTRKRSFMN